ncbi:sigma-70 family RNA polymerase sigma factor [Streptomyces sp. WMMC500]|uniref:sigma-70 family RNA polymerase sigma factor n=1 Tax=Streptomyces sp. WMMC500 TaxID=3015154 RepID=UPI00248CA44B|nr:sigma-70 family RNA polymerase sigma factor [Streptomyces sp. WMMC500]WBB58320.1 sigma-70 family RNA polymerase sigma factor [Streptomyces sp. WMMC500]
MSETPTADADLTARVRAAPPGAADAALDELYRRHRAAVLAYARSCTRDPHTAEDLASEAFAGALRAVRGGSGPDGPWRPYLLATVRRTAAAWSRTARRTELSPDFESWLTRAPTVESSEEGTLRREDANLVLRAFRSLPERWQTALWHSAVEGESPDRIAPLLGLTTSGVASLTARAREGLREAYLAERAGDAGAPAECRHYTGLLAASVRRGGRRRGQRGLEHHLAVCRRCRRTSAELRELNGSLAAALPASLLLWAGASYGVGGPEGAPGSGEAGAALDTGAPGTGAEGSTPGTGAGTPGANGASDPTAAGAAGTADAATAGAAGGTAAPGGEVAEAGAAAGGAGTGGAHGAVATLGSTSASTSASVSAGGASGAAASSGLAAAVKAASVGAAVLAVVVTGYTTLPGGGDPPPQPVPTATTAAPTPTAERSNPAREDGEDDPDDPPPTASADRTGGPEAGAADDGDAKGDPDRKPTASGAPPAGDAETGPPPDWSPPADDRTTLPVAATGRCMDIAAAAGAQPYEADCDGTRSQQWELLVSLPPVQEVRLRNHATGMCLTHSGTDADGAPVRQQPGACASDAATAHWKYFLDGDDKVVFTQRDSSGQFLGLDDWRAAAEGRPHAPDIGTTANYEATPSLRFFYRGPAFGY